MKGPPGRKAEPATCSARPSPRTQISRSQVSEMPPRSGPAEAEVTLTVRVPVLPPVDEAGARIAARAPVHRVRSKMAHGADALGQPGVWLAEHLTINPEHESCRSGRIPSGSLARLNVRALAAARGRYLVGGGGCALRECAPAGQRGDGVLVDGGHPDDAPPRQCGAAGWGGGGNEAYRQYCDHKSSSRAVKLKIVKLSCVVMCK